MNYKFSKKKKKVGRTEITPVETIINADIATSTVGTLTTVSKTDTGVSAVVDCGGKFFSFGGTSSEREIRNIMHTVLSTFWRLSNCQKV